MKYNFSFFRRSKKEGEEKKQNGKKFFNSDDLDKKLVLSLSKNKIPSFKQFKHLPKFLSRTESLALKILGALIILSAGILGWQFYYNNTVQVPDFGGQYTEALVGSPKFINPILSQTNDVDRDISRLVFSSLLKYDAKQKLAPDLAEKYEISEDQKTYTIYLRDNLYWHDGEKLTANDVIFTVKSIQDPEYKSPLYNSLRGVSIRQIDERTVAFILEEPFAPFPEILTFGIMPAHIWGDIPAATANLAEFNIKPIGSGPFKFASLSKDKLGNIKSMSLERNEGYYNNKPYIEKINFKFYPDFHSATDALQNKNVEGISFLPKELKNKLQREDLNFYSLQIPQYTAVFFNQTKNKALEEDEVRQSLTLATPKEQLREEALNGEGIIINGPILPGYIGYNPEIKKYNFSIEEANTLLDEETDWDRLSIEEYKNQRLEEELKKLEEQKEAEAEEQAVKTETESESEENSSDNKASDEQTQENISGHSEETDEPEKTPEEIITGQIETEINPGQPFFRENDGDILQITLTTVDQPENIAAADILKESWQQIGFRVNLNIVPPTEIRRTTIRERNYEALLYAEILGSDPDPYPFWHSSQNQHPGLNLAVFANRHVDRLLEEARQTADEEQRRLKYIDFQNILAEELPAIFLYSPTYTYVVDEKIKNITAERLSVPADRFADIEEWYIKTKRKFK